MRAQECKDECTMKHKDEVTKNTITKAQEYKEESIQIYKDEGTKIQG